jgi:hypothetical protein
MAGPLGKMNPGRRPGGASRRHRASHPVQSVHQPRITGDVWPRSGRDVTVREPAGARRRGIGDPGGVTLGDTVADRVFGRRGEESDADWDLGLR